MMMFLSQFLITLEIIAPIFLIILLGKYLHTTGMLDQQFVNTSSQLVFRVTLPLLLFTKFVSYSYDSLPFFDIFKVIYIVVGLMFLLAWGVGHVTLSTKKDIGILVHGAYRSNFGVIGLAIVDKATDSQGLAAGALILALITPIYNALGVVSVTLASDTHLSIRKILKQIALNPLIVACYFAAPCLYFELELPSFLLDTGQYLSSLTLPLALLGIGASLTYPLKELISSDALLAVFLKLVVTPCLGVYFIFQTGLPYTWSLPLLILFGCPTAVVTFSFADAMRANSPLAGKIIVLSTILSLITLSIGITLLRISQGATG